MLIGKKYKVESDDTNVTLFERKVITGTARGKQAKKAIGEEYWLQVGYFSTVQNALHYLVEQEIKGTGMKDFETVVAKIEELHNLNGLKFPDAVLSDTTDAG